MLANTGARQRVVSQITVHRLRVYTCMCVCAYTMAIYIDIRSSNAASEIVLCAYCDGICLCAACDAPRARFYGYTIAAVWLMLFCTRAAYIYVYIARFCLIRCAMGSTIPFLDSLRCFDRRVLNLTDFFVFLFSMRRELHYFSIIHAVYNDAYFFFFSSICK